MASVSVRTMHVPVMVPSHRGEPTGIEFSGRQT